MNLQDRFLGCLLGLAAGDAVGTTVKFRSEPLAPREEIEQPGVQLMQNHQRSRDLRSPHKTSEVFPLRPTAMRA